MKEDLKQIYADHDARFASLQERLRMPDYIQFSKRGYIEAIYCKKCGTLIRSLIPDEDRREVTNQRGIQTIRERLVMQSLANYAEVQIEMEDGSVHVTNCCTSCAPVLTKQDLEDFIVADLETMRQESRIARQPMPDNLMRFMASRQVKGIAEGEVR